MAFLAHLPQILNDPTVELDRNPNYPFDQFNTLSGDELLDILREYIGNRLEAAYPIKPLDFTKYTIDMMRCRYGSPYGKLRPLYFFHHWVAHPQKRTNIDMSQKTKTDGAVAIWKKFGRTVTFYQNGNVPRAYKTKYKLYEATGNRKEEKSVFNLAVYEFTPSGYPNAENFEQKKSVWSLVKLYRDR